MKNANRPLWLFSGFLLLVTISFLVLIVVYPEKSSTALIPATDVQYRAGHHPLKEGVEQKNLSLVMKKVPGAGSGYGLCIGDHAEAYLLSLTGAADTAGIAPLIHGGGKLGFYELYTFPELAAPLNLLMHKRPSLLIPARAFLRDGSNEFPACIGYVKKDDTTLLEAMLRESSLSDLFPADTRFAYRQQADGMLEVYAIRHEHAAVFSSQYILEASSRINLYSGEPQVVVSFGPEASTAWDRLIRSNKGRPLAICVNNRVLSVPVVREEALNSLRASATGMAKAT